MRLTYEPLAPHHAALVWADVQAPELYTYIDEQQPPSLAWLEARYTRLAAGSQNAGEAWRNWIVRDLDLDLDLGGAPIGTLQATLYKEPARAELAWVVFPRYWRRGYASIATRWLVDEVARAGIAHFTATVDARNVASFRVAEKLGFTHTRAHDSDIDLVLRLRQVAL